MENPEVLGWEGWFSLGVVLLCFALFLWGRAAPDIVTAAGLTLLLLFGIVTPQEGLAGFSNEGMLTVAVLYVVVTGLTGTGAIGWIVDALLGRPRSPTDARLRLMSPVAALSAFLNNTPVVAVFIPAVEDWANRPAEPWIIYTLSLRNCQSRPSCRSFVRDTSITFTCSATCCTPPTVIPQITSL